MTVTIKSPAKINLALDTLYKREDNYHEVKMIMTTIDLADYITVTSLERDQIKISSNAYAFFPLNTKNLAYRAAKLFKNHFKISAGVEIYVKKQIPVSAGLGGGSSNAAATLKALKELWNVDCTLEELAMLGAKLGSDVPFFIYGGTALATGRGEIIQTIPSIPKCWVILVNPRIHVSTKEIYKNLDLSKKQPVDVEGMLACIEAKDYRGVCEKIGNTLEDVTMKQYPVVAEIKKKLEKFGADAVLMSGSGSTVFALVQKEAKAKRITNSVNGCFKEYTTFTVRLLG